MRIALSVILLPPASLIVVSGFRDQGSGFIRDQGSGFIRDQGGIRDQGSGFIRDQGSDQLIPAGIGVHQGTGIRAGSGIRHQGSSGIRDHQRSGTDQGSGFIRDQGSPPVKSNHLRCLPVELSPCFEHPGCIQGLPHVSCPRLSLTHLPKCMCSCMWMVA